MNTIPDIPRIYTALAEWAACIIYLLPLSGRLRGWRLVGVSALALVIQAVFLDLTGTLPIPLWLPVMVVAVGLMFCFLYLASRGTALDAGYRCILAFVLAEFTASLEWQIHCYVWTDGSMSLYGWVLLAVVYGGVFALMHYLLTRTTSTQGSISMTPKEFGSALIIGVAAFSVSNLTYLPNPGPFAGDYGSAVLQLRTLVDLGGVAILFAHYLQCKELRMRQELQAVHSVLQNQYVQYQQSKESIELINRKYHDLKHQIAVLRAESDPQRRNDYLNQMEAEIQTYEAQNKTGNPVLDTVLTSKSLSCAHGDITFTCVADGTLLNFMSAMDLCTLVGNAMDNAMECEAKIPEKEKRLIHLSLSQEKTFVLLRVENYCETPLVFRDGLPTTTKANKNFHGYGLKSIRYVAKKYGGTATATVMNNWFELKVLLPLAQKGQP